DAHSDGRRRGGLGRLLAPSTGLREQREEDGENQAHHSGTSPRAWPPAATAVRYASSERGTLSRASAYTLSASSTSSSRPLPTPPSAPTEATKDPSAARVPKRGPRTHAGAPTIRRQLQLAAPLAADRVDFPMSRLCRRTRIHDHRRRLHRLFAGRDEADVGFFECPRPDVHAGQDCE